MPILRGAASDVTTLRKRNATILTDPSVKSASYVPNQPQLLGTINTSRAGQGVYPVQSALATSIWTAYVNPRHRGLIVGPPPVEPGPIVQYTLDYEGISLDVENGTATIVPNDPITSAVFVLTNFLRGDLMDTVTISDFLPSEYDFENMTMSAAPAFGEQNTFIYNAYEFSPGDYVDGAVFTVTFPTPVAGFFVNIVNSFL
jgi:hypothetical protein